jgi:mono/diheme cytochrome c family protein
MSEQPNPPGPPASGSSEPRLRSVTVPVWLMVVLFLLFYWGALYFDQDSAWFNPQVYAPYHSVEQLKSFQIRVGGSEVIERGKAIYGKTCIACHQATGQGSPGQFPPLRGSEWVNEQEPGRVIRIALQGLHGPITVKGMSFNNTMVPWNILSDSDLAAVLTYVRQNKDWGNKAPAVTPAQVKAIRDKIQKTHPGAYTPAELLNISPAE